jgi:hypothetical protein
MSKVKTISEIVDQNFENFEFDHLNILQVGRIGEYWVKIWLTLSGFDTYHNDVDDKGIDFILRLDNSKHIDIQVKTVRQNTKYVFVPKKSWQNELRENLYLALVLLENNKMPIIFMIPSIDWKKPNDLLKDRNYLKEGQTSNPEWGVNLSRKNMELLNKYNMKNFVEKITA